MFDLVADLLMTGVPDAVSPLVPLELPGLTMTSYSAYPLADHLADKVCALFETHERASGLRQPSTRFRDMVDLAIFAHTISVEATALGVALKSEAKRRSLVLPDTLAAPIGGDWPSGYARVARDAPQLKERDLVSAVEIVGRFIDPVLSEIVHGQWNPRELCWQDADADPSGS
jgi:hypothetical protein